MHDPWNMFTDSSEDKVRKNKGLAELAFVDRCFIGEFPCASEQQASHAMNGVRSSFQVLTIVLLG